MAFVPTNSSMAPWKMFIVASVTMNVGILKNEMKNAFTAPKAIPMTLEMAKASHRLSTPRPMMAFTVMYCATMATAGKEMSMPPDRSTTKNPMARIAMPALDRIRSNMFSTVKNAGFTIVMAREKTTITRNR